MSFCVPYLVGIKDAVEDRFLTSICVSLRWRRCARQIIRNAVCLPVFFVPLVTLVCWPVRFSWSLVLCGDKLEVKFEAADDDEDLVLGLQLLRLGFLTRLSGMRSKAGS